MPAMRAFVVRVMRAPRSTRGFLFSARPYAGVRSAVSAAGVYTRRVSLETLPGGDLVQEGLADLARGARPSRAPGLDRRAAPAPPGSAGAGAAISSPEHRLYERLAETDSDSAHSRYNALVRPLVSFENAAECAGL